MRKMIGRVKNMMNREPSLHRCPSCGSGLSRLQVFSGGINNRLRLVDYTLTCRECGAVHRVRGDNSYTRYIWCVASK